MPLTSVDIRPFDPARDLDAVAAIHAPEWQHPLAIREERMVQGRMDVAGVLGWCTIRLAAWRDDRLVGIAFAHVDGAEPADAARWGELWDSCAVELAVFDTPAATWALGYERGLAPIHEALVDAAQARLAPGGLPSAELALFMVDRQARGLGVGGRLIAALESELRAVGVGSYFLQTDSTCSWRWYGRHGFEAVVDLALSELGKPCGVTRGLIFAKRLAPACVVRPRIRNASMADLDAIAALEAQGFPPAEAASRESIARRLAAFASHCWVLEDEAAPQQSRLVSFVIGMSSPERDLRDEMYDDPGLYDEAGAWEMIFSVVTDAARQGVGCASHLLRHVIEVARAAGRAGLVLTCKEHRIPLYARLGFVDEGVSGSQHGGVPWHQMRLAF